MWSRSVVRIGWLGVLAVFVAASSVAGAADREAERIQPWEEDARYWQYKGEPVLLMGVSDMDNLFNHPDIGPGSVAP